MLGLAARGDPAGPQLDRTTGLGWVGETTTHQYADAQRRGHPVTLLACESTGALSTSFYSALYALDRQSRLKTTHDSTVYGIGRASPRTFLAHHLAAHSSAVVMANAVTVHDYAAKLAVSLSAGVAA